MGVLDALGKALSKALSATDVSAIERYREGLPPGMSQEAEYNAIKDYVHERYPGKIFTEALEYRGKDGKIHLAGGVRRLPGSAKEADYRHAREKQLERDGYESKLNSDLEAEHGDWEPDGA